MNIIIEENLKGSIEIRKMKCDYYGDGDVVTEVTQQNYEKEKSKSNEKLNKEKFIDYSKIKVLFFFILSSIKLEYSFNQSPRINYYSSKLKSASKLFSGRQKFMANQTNKLQPGIRG